MTKMVIPEALDDGLRVWNGPGRDNRYLIRVVCREQGKESDRTGQVFVQDSYFDAQLYGTAAMCWTFVRQYEAPFVATNSAPCPFVMMPLLVRPLKNAVKQV